jgi:hypothetical protein
LQSALTQIEIGHRSRAPAGLGGEGDSGSSKETGP